MSTIYYRLKDQPREGPPPEGDAPAWRPPPAHIPGVPLGDISQEEYEALPAHLQRAVAASPLYKATAAAPAPPERKTAEVAADPPPAPPAAETNTSTTSRRRSAPAGEEA